MTGVDAVVVTSPRLVDNHLKCSVFCPYSRWNNGTQVAGQTFVLNVWPARGNNVPAELNIGDVLHIDAPVRRPRNMGNPDEFDYASWLWCQGVTGIIHASAIQLTVAQDSAAAATRHGLPIMMRLRLKALQWREHLIDIYRSADIGDEAFALIAALTLADRSQLQASTREAFAEAGASHLLALSGLHLGILLVVLMALLNGPLLLSAWRRPLCLMAIVLTWSFAFLVGLPTSLVRACVMTTVFLFAGLLHAEVSSRHSLLLTVGVMLALQPTYLFDVGAQLSVAAVAGITTLYSPMYMFLFRRWRYVVFWMERYWLFWPVKMILVSIAAQVFTLPLVAYYFHRIPLYGVLINIAVIPITVVLLYCGLLLLLSAALWPSLAACVAWLIKMLVAVLLAVVQFTAGLPGANINDFWSRRAQPQLVVYNNRRCPALHVITSPDHSVLMMPRPELADSGLAYIRSNFWQRRLTAEPVPLQKHNALLLNGLRVAMLADNDNALPHEADVLWICGNYSGRLDTITLARQPRLVILDASLPAYRRQEYQLVANKNAWPIWDIATRGALVLPLPLNLQDNIRTSAPKHPQVGMKTSGG